MCTTAASKIAVTGGGFLAAVFMSFIATTGWRLSTRKFDVSLVPGTHIFYSSADRCCFVA